MPVERPLFILRSELAAHGLDQRIPGEAPFSRRLNVVAQRQQISAKCLDVFRLADLAVTGDEGRVRKFRELALIAGRLCRRGGVD